MRQIGVDWEDLGKNIFGGVHVAGRTIASAFGGAGLADMAEKLESPILPDWAKRGQAADIRIFDNVALNAVTAKNVAKTPVIPAAPKKTSSITETTVPAAPKVDDVPEVGVTRPDFIAVYHKNVKPTDKPEWTPNVTAVGIWGGKRLPGSKPAYDPKKDAVPGKKFSFAYDAPTRVDIVTVGPDGKVSTTVLKDVRQIAFAGGEEMRADGKAVVGGGFLSAPVVGPVKWWHLALLTAAWFVTRRK